MQSMTGYGEARREGEGLTILARAVSTNGRSLQVASRLPDVLAGHEPEVESMIRSKFARGSIVISVEIEQASQERTWTIDTARLSSYYQQAVEFSRKLNLREELPLSALLSLPGVLREVSQGEVQERPGLLEAARAVVEEAVGAMEATRIQEGAEVKQTLAALLESVEALARKLEDGLPQAVAAYKERITQRVRALIEAADVSVDPADLAREVALLAERGDVSEELQRLNMHVRNFREEMAKDGAVGRKLEFIAQELSRESATLSAKMVEPAFLRTALELRSEVDKIKEQVRNVE